MAQIKVCDVCLADGKVVGSKWRGGFKKPHMKLDYCDEHRGHHSHLNADDFDAAAFDLLGKGRAEAVKLGF